MNTQKNIRIIQLLFLVSLFATGLFYEYIACIFCGCFGFFFFVQSLHQKRMKFYCNSESLTLTVIVFFYLATAFYGIDTGMGWIGFLKILTIFFFACCTMQLTEDERNKVLGMVPPAGCVMTIIGIFSYLIKPLYQFFFVADRFGGFFQYPNVFALFCLVGIIILMDARKENISKFILFPQIILLAAGILLSGSRTVFFLAMAVCLFFVITHKKARIPILAALGVLFVIVAVYVGLTGNMQNIGRFLTTSIHSSTFLGRLLYFKDGLRLLASHPFGLGYLGYYFLEPSIQTGVYSIRFIHNDFLQLSLDIGILPCLLLLWAFISNIFGKGKNMKNRLILSVIAIHCLVDFDLEFTAIWFLILLSWDMYHGKELNIAAGGKTAFYKILAGLLAAAAIYTGAAMIPRYLENAKLSATLLPFYTEAKKEVLAQETNVVQAEQMSKELLQQNGYVSEAYDILAATAYQQNDYLKMAEYKKKSVELQKYNMDAYERYIVLLSGAIETVIANEDTQTLQSLMQYVVDVDTRRKEVEEETDALAYLIRDLPDFTMAEEAEDYIVQVKQLLGK